MNVSLFFKSLLFLVFASIACASHIKEFMVPYEDGVKFYTVSITPSSTGKYPVVVYRTPYTSNNLKGNQNTQSKTKIANNTIITGKSTITLYTK